MLQTSRWPDSDRCQAQASGWSFELLIPKCTRTGYRNL